MKKPKEIKVKFARREKTVYDFSNPLDKTEVYDVVLYDDAKCSKLYSRIPYWFKCKPTKDMDEYDINCNNFKLIWKDDVNE